MKTQQPDLLPDPDFRVLTVFVDQFITAAAKLKADGFRVDSWDWLCGHGKYVLHASRILTSNVADN